MEEPRLNLLIYNKNSASMKPLTKIIQPKVYISTLWSFNKETTSNPLTINESRFLQFLFIKNKNIYGQKIVFTMNLIIAQVFTIDKKRCIENNIAIRKILKHFGCKEINNNVFEFQYLDDFRYNINKKTFQNALAYDNKLAYKPLSISAWREIRKSNDINLHKLMYYCFYIGYGTVVKLKTLKYALEISDRKLCRVRNNILEKLEILKSLDVIKNYEINNDRILIIQNNKANTDMLKYKFKYIDYDLLSNTECLDSLNIDIKKTIQ